ncbi:MAG: phosphoribosylformylglycinamidine cyclo-ligase [Candidatus Tantalella remota]|nr:phosphoribosylformylglycinamidine cyclo-ligase [Candidatus Tantalella remota]
MNYKKAGVDIDKADALIKKAKALINTTRVKGSMDSVGGFGGFFDPAASGIKNALLVAATDGVGTKLKVAQIAGKHDTVGIDLVAMCVNDILCSGAKPLFFLDYFASGKLRKKEWSEVIKGIVDGCRQSGCALLGGETAEMPGMYAGGEYDLAGFSVGVVDRRKVIDGSKVKAGDVLLGLASTGLHSNGYSLVRKVFTKKQIKQHYRLILKPTRIYVKPFLAVADACRIKAAAHITGGGFYDNIPRMLPKGVKAVVRTDSWSIPSVYKLIKKNADISRKDLFRTFNMGIGMVLALSKKDAEKAQKILGKKFKLKSWVIGEIVKGKRSAELV